MIRDAINELRRQREVERQAREIGTTERHLDAVARTLNQVDLFASVGGERIGVDVLRSPGVAMVDVLTAPNLSAIVVIFHDAEDDQDFALVAQIGATWGANLRFPSSGGGLGTLALGEALEPDAPRHFDIDVIAGWLQVERFIPLDKIIDHHKIIAFANAEGITFTPRPRKEAAR